MRAERARGAVIRDEMQGVEWAAEGAPNRAFQTGNQEGAKTADSTKTMEQLMDELSSACEAACKEADEQGSHIVFLHVKEGTIDSCDNSVQGGNSHNFTWQYAYNIPELVEWVRAQSL